MNKLTLFICGGVIVMLPVLYAVMTGIHVEEARNFRGHDIVAIAPEDGTVFVPNKTENKQGVPMRASLKSAYLEKVSGLKFPGNAGVELSVDSVSRKITECPKEAVIPAQAPYELAVSCAKAAFDKLAVEHKTDLTMDAAEQFIIFGASGNNQVRLYHNGMIATYASPDMTQTDRKREACIVRIALDGLMGRKASLETSCAKKPQS